MLKHRAPGRAGEPLPREAEDVGADASDDVAADDALIVPKLELPAERVRALSVLNPIQAVGRIAIEWALVVAAVLLCQHFWSWPVYVLAVIWIGARQHALLVLMHEATHHRLLRSRRSGDALSDLLCAWPLLVATDAYRRVHFPHHRYLSTSRDPEWRANIERPEYRLPKRWFDFGLLFLRDISGLGALSAMRAIARLYAEELEPQGTSWRWAGWLGRCAFYAAVAAAVTVLGGWQIVLLYWIVPMLTWLKWTMYLRGLAEHYGLEGGGEPLASSRTTLPSWFGRWLIAPHNVHYHLDHHLYPSVPCFRLPQLHRELAMDPVYSTRAHIVHGYLAVLAECVGYRPRTAVNPA